MKRQEVEWAMLETGCFFEPDDFGRGLAVLRAEVLRLRKDRERLQFMIRNNVTFEYHPAGWKAWGFSGCSVVPPSKTKTLAIDAAIRATRKDRGGKL